MAEYLLQNLTINQLVNFKMLLFTYVRLADGFSYYSRRLKYVQARLKALSVLIYSNQLTDSIQV